MAKENQKPSVVSAFIVPIGLSVAIVLGIAQLAPKTMASYTQLQGLNTLLAEKTAAVETAQQELNQLKEKVANEDAKEQAATKSEKQFYKPIESGMSTEAVITGEFTEILQLIRANQIKVRSIKYDYDPSDDNFVKNAASVYNVARLNMEMIANYSDYDNFLKEIYKHEHFLDIQSVEIVPYRKNKKILLINFKVKLYAKKQ